MFLKSVPQFRQLETNRTIRFWAFSNRYRRVALLFGVGAGRCLSSPVVLSSRKMIPVFPPPGRFTITPPLATIPALRVTSMISPLLPAMGTKNLSFKFRVRLPHKRVRIAA